MQIARLRSHVQVQAHLLYLTEQAAPIEIAGAPPSDRRFPVAKNFSVAWQNTIAGRHKSVEARRNPRKRP